MNLVFDKFDTTKIHQLNRKLLRRFGYAEPRILITAAELVRAYDFTTDTDYIVLHYHNKEVFHAKSMDELHVLLSAFLALEQ